MLSLKPITPDILHKDCEEDILIRNPRDIIPTWIDGELVSTLVQTWTESDRALFNAAYREEDGIFVLRSVPLYLDQQMMKATSDFEIDLSQYYLQHLDRLRLSERYVPNAVETYLRQTFLPSISPVEQAEASHIMCLLAPTPGWSSARVSSYMVLNDTKNYFFYRKPHEHVPGLMLIETARQAMYHYFYSFSGYERGDVSISITNLHVSFFTYIESVYDVEVLVMQTEGLARSKPRFVDKTARFYQNGRLVARVRLEGGAMKMNLFRRMRTLNFPENHWFIPSKRISSHLLIGIEGDLPVQAKLVMLSLRFMQLNITPGCIDRRCSARNVSLHIEGGGFLCLPVASVKATSDGGTVLAELGCLSREQMAALKEVVKCHCFFAKHDERFTGLSAETEPFIPLISEAA